MTRRQRWRSSLDRLRERSLGSLVVTCRRLQGPLRPLGLLGIVLANLLSALLGLVADLVLPAGGRRQPSGPIQHVFVLVLENRSFDHLLGFSMMAAGAGGELQPASGIDAQTGQSTTVDGPDPGRDRNGDQPAGPGAPAVMPDDPPHEFPDIRTQLCGQGGDYPRVDMSGFVDSYRSVKPADPGLVMRGFGAAQVPVISTLAREFAVCDRWFSALPGPTWPNRFFWHAASSAGLDCSPSTARTAAASFVDGYVFANGTIYERLEAAGYDWAIYHGDAFPQSLAIADMDANLVRGRFHHLEELATDLQRPDFAPSYVFIEPDYGQVLPHPTFIGGSSQHPVDDIAGGERLIKLVYEAIRASPLWERSLLIVAYDEHGGFYDHVPPPAAVPPGDPMTDPENNRHGFDFSLLGVRVPAVVVSPLIPRGLVDHVQHDHTAALATVERRFGLQPLTRRDATANDLSHLLSLSEPRVDTPLTLPEPPSTPTLAEPAAPAADEAELDPIQVGFLQVALRRHLTLARSEEERRGMAEQARAVSSRADAARYRATVEQAMRERGG